MGAPNGVLNLICFQTARIGVDESKAVHLATKAPDPSGKVCAENPPPSGRLCRLASRDLRCRPGC